MSRNSRELDKFQRGLAKVVGPAKARALRKELEKKIAQAAAPARGGRPAKPKAQIVKEMVAVGQAGWVTLHGTANAALVQKGHGLQILRFKRNSDHRHEACGWNPGRGQRIEL